MIIGKNIKSLYDKHKKEFHALMALEQSKPISNSDLSHTLYDLNGMAYYSFNDTVNLPLERLGEIERYKFWLSSGCHEETIETLAVAGDKLLSEGLTKPFVASKMGLIFSELRERKNMALPTPLLYNILAVQLIREDENPHIVNQAIQKSKVFELERLSETGNFFFGLKELKLLHDFLSMSEEEWNTYWQSSKLIHEARDKAMLKVLDSPL